VCTPAGEVVNVVAKDIGFLSNGINIDAYLQALKNYLNTNNTE